MKSDFHERKVDKIERANTLAEKAAAESESRRKTADHLSQAFWMGQPILVGHHSENRARATQARMHANMSKSIELDKKSQHYAEQAERLANDNGPISSDDPEALDKLQKKLEALEWQSENYATINKAYRAFAKKGAAALEGFDLTDARKAYIASWSPQYPSEKAPILPWMMSNLNGRIKQVRERIAKLEKMESLADTTEEINGVIIKSMPSENRVMLVFDGKPAAEVIQQCKSRGFRWAPTYGAWMRQYSTYALYEARTICEKVQNG